MSNERSLSARPQPTSPVLGALRAYGASVLLGVCLLMLALQASTASAQLCDPQAHWVTGTVSIGDGSTVAGAQAGVGWLLDGSTGGASFPTPGPLPGTIVVKDLPDPGASPKTYSFIGVTSGAYSPVQGGSATCQREPGPNPNNCYTCSGGFGVTFHSRQASIKGTVTWEEDGAGTPDIHVIADPYPVGMGLWRGAFTDSSGHYHIHDPAQPQNKWGVNLHDPGLGGGPASAVLQTYPYNADAPYQDVPLSSNQLGKADFVVSRPDGETSPRCGDEPLEGAGPAPLLPCCRIANPVSVTTGNVDVDQTDAVVPGRGLGLNFTRSYNSENSAVAERYGVFGPGWNHSYEKRLTFPWDGTIKLRNSDGTITYFVGDDTKGYQQTVPYSKDSWIEHSVGSLQYVRQFRRGGQELYDRLTSSGPAARLVSLADAVGNTTVLTYAGDQLIAIVDPGGRQLALGYSANQLATLSLGPPASAQLIATYTYASGRLSVVTYADGDGDGQLDGKYTFAYHTTGYGAGKLWTVTDGTGRVTETHAQYDANGRVAETSISGNVRKYTLAYQADRTTVTDSLGNATTYEWKKIAGRKRVTRIAGCSACGSGGSATGDWTYDEKGRITSHTDGEGNVTEYTYDNDGNLALIEAPVLATGQRHTTEYTYDAYGRVATRIAPNLATTTWTYLPAGPETITEQVSSGVTRTTTLGYHTLPRAKGKLQFVRDALNRQTDLTYTGTGDLSSVTDPSGHVTTFIYDLMGRRTKTVPATTTPANDTPTTSYDTLGRVWKVTSPLSGSPYWRYTYDLGGRRTIARDPAGHNTTYAYDPYGRLSTVTNSPDGTTNYVTEYRYDAMSNLRYLIDPRQYPQPSPVPTTATELRYEDGHNRVTSTHYPGDLSESFIYDLAGRLVQRTDRKGVATTLTYDAMGRVTMKSYSDSTPSVGFEYDGGDDTGFLTEASNPADTLTWDYDLAGQILSEASSRNGTTVSYQYFLTGERQKLRLNGADVLTYGYQPDGQLDTLTRAPGVVFDFNPDAAHRRQSVAFPNGTSTEYGYDLASRLTLVLLKKGAVALNSIAYEFNDLDSRTSRTENGTRLEYTYDHLSRLDAVNQTLPTPVLKEDYSYDPVGNRLMALGVPGTWSYNERNELTSYNGVSLTYDLNGNTKMQSALPVRNYSWTVENQLKSVGSSGLELMRAEYDPLGRRVAKGPNPGAMTRFAYDGEDVLFEQGPSGNVTYLHGPGIDEPLARETSTGVRTYYHADGLGSVVKRTDGAGNVVGTQVYDAFGHGAGLPNGYGFTAREWDGEVGLDFYRARFLDPATGRFLSQDPIQFRGGLNFYTYVGNNPASEIDPFGLQASPPGTSLAPSRAPDFCTLTVPLLGPFGVFNASATLVTAPGLDQHRSFFGGSLGSPACSLTCSVIDATSISSIEVVHFLKRGRASIQSIVGFGGGRTLSANGQRSKDRGVGLAMGPSLGYGSCPRCKTVDMPLPVYSPDDEIWN